MALAARSRGRAGAAPMAGTRGHHQCPRVFTRRRVAHQRGPRRHARTLECGGRKGSHAAGCGRWYAHRIAQFFQRWPLARRGRRQSHAPARRAQRRHRVAAGGVRSGVLRLSGADDHSLRLSREVTGMARASRRRGAAPGAGGRLQLRTLARRRDAGGERPRSHSSARCRQRCVAGGVWQRQRGAAWCDVILAGQPDAGRVCAE